MTDGASAASIATGAALWVVPEVEEAPPATCVCALGALDVSPASLLEDEEADPPCAHCVSNTKPTTVRDSQMSPWALATSCCDH